MSTQPSSTAKDSTGVSRDEKLLRERITAGESMIDHLCHPEARHRAAAVFRRIERMELTLERFRRYPVDFLNRVMPAEDARWHTPPGTPDQHLTSPCGLCVALDRASEPHNTTLTGLPVAA